MDDDVRCHVAECKEIISEKVSKEAKAINTIIVISSTHYATITSLTDI